MPSLKKYVKEMQQCNNNSNKNSPVVTMYLPYEPLVATRARNDYTVAVLWKNFSLGQ